MDTPTTWMISVDDHVLEPGHVWHTRLPTRYQELGPRLSHDASGEAWFYENKRIPTLGLAAAAGRDKEEFSPLPMTYEDMRPGCYDPVARLEDMNRDGVLASMWFRSFPRFCGQTFSESEDKELGLLCIRAYNDWMIEEWSASAPGRYIPMVIIPLWDPRLAAQEIERTAAMGARAIAFSENPTPLGYPSIHDADGYWTPVFAAASETRMPLCTHLGSSSQLPKTSPDCPLLVTLALTPVASVAAACIDWLFSGILPKYPNLKICLSEGGIGWIPYVLERCDYVAERQGGWAAKSDFQVDLLSGDASEVSTRGALDLSKRPSEIFRDHIYGCFIDDEHGSESLDVIGVDNVMMETDYPHTDSSWPHSSELAEKRLAKYSSETRYKVLRGNAQRVFNFTPAEPPTTS
jgi:predicted TIM-barrel fold metal-dependent hydrolase